MLGRTNAVFVADEGGNASFELVQEAIVTPSASAVQKIECLNGIFLAFLEDGKVLHGSDVHDLSVIMREGEPFLASHAVYANETYYFVKADEKFEGKVKVCKTVDFTEFEDAELIETENGCTVFGIYMTKAGKIVILYGNEDMLLHIYISDQLLSATASVMKTSYTYYAKSNTSTYKKGSRMLNDKIILKEPTGFSTSTRMLICALDGTVIEAENKELSYFAHGCFYEGIKNNANLVLYYSLNGIDFNRLVTVDGIIGSYNGTKLIDVMELEDGAVGIFIHNSTGGMMFTIMESAMYPGDQFQNVKVVSLPGTFLCYLYRDGFTYIGCTGGLILKTHIDYSGDSALPGIKVLKTLSAKQALEEAKKYTDECFATLEAMIANMKESGNG